MEVVVAAEEEVVAVALSYCFGEAVVAMQRSKIF